MAEVVLFHRALGLTPGIIAFADSTLPSYDADAAALLRQQVLSFLSAR